MSKTEKWSDLTTRVTSAVAMVLLGAVGIWLGGMCSMSWWRLSVA